MISLPAPPRYLCGQALYRNAQQRAESQKRDWKGAPDRQHIGMEGRAAYQFRCKVHGPLGRAVTSGARASVAAAAAAPQGPTLKFWSSGEW